MRRSRRNGQLRRVSSWSFGSHSASRISSVSRPALARIRPKGSARNEPPQNSSPPPAGALVADPVHGADVHPVGDGVGALDGLPRARLGRAELGLLGRMPADRRGIEEDLRALQGRQPGGFGIPLVPADQRAHPAEPRRKGLEAQVAGREVVLLVVERVVGDVHLAIAAAEGAVGVEHHRRVVIDARRALLEDRADHDHPASRGPRRPAPRWSGPGWARPGRTWPGPRSGRSTGSGTAPAGTPPGLPGRPHRGASHRPGARCRPGRSSTASGSGPRETGETSRS